jgi:hypothetical protein
MNENQEISTPARPISRWLWVGIFFAPVIFSWLTLRSGHGRTQRAIAFGWLGVFLLISATRPNQRQSTDAAKASLQTAAEQRSETDDTAKPVTGDWYSKGTLHDVAVEVWLAATPQNQLATSADWALKAPSVQQKVRASGNMETLRPYASAVQGCVTKAFMTDMGRSSRSSELASACVLAMGFW